MKTQSPLFFYFRIILVSLLIALLNLGPRPHVAARLLDSANQAIASDDLLTTSQNLAKTAKYYPWRYELYLAAGRYALEAGNPKVAILYLEQTGAVSHLTIDDMILLGDAYYQIDKPYMAEAIWKHVTELSDSSTAYKRLADLNLQRKDYVPAVNILQKLLSFNPSEIHLYYQIGSLYAAIDPLKALPYLIQAAEIDPANATQAQSLHDKIRTASLIDEPAYTLLISGRQLANWGQWDLAAVAFQHAIDLRPEYAEAWAFLGEARQQLAKQENGSSAKEGLSELVHALQLDSNSILGNTFMGLYWERQGDYSQAVNFLTQANALSPSDPFLLSELGNIQAKAGDLPAAQSSYMAAIQLSPQDPLFYRLLAEFALQYQIQIREIALPAARQTITIDPYDASSLDVMAQVMLMLQDYHSAERFAVNAVIINPGYVPAYLHLGTAYIYLEEPDLARQWLGLAETVNPQSWAASQAKRMLDYYFP